MAFDPCREWLGLDALELADPRRVLGLPTEASDAEAIARAAAARLEALGRIEPGPFAKAHAALVAKVEESRDALLTEALLDEPRLRPAPPPLPSQRRVFVVPDIEADDSAPPAPAPASTLDDLSPPSAEEVVPRPVVLRRSRRAGSASNPTGGLLLATLALLAATVGLMLGLMLGPEGIGRLVPGSSRSTVSPNSGPRLDVRKPAPSATAATGPRLPPKPAVPTVAEPVRSAALSGAPVPATDEEPRPLMVAPPAGRDTELSAAAEHPGDPSAAAGRRPGQEMAEAKQERNPPGESLGRSLREAYAAVQRGEFDTADRLLAAAGTEVGDDVEAATRLERWRLFAAYAREFTGYRDQAFEAAKAGRDYTVNGKTFALIEITPELFIYKLAGRIERVSRGRLDPGIELAVVEKWFAADGRPANHLFLGARWLSLRPPNVGRARAEWRLAGEGGEEVGGLLALLDDPLIRGAAPGARP